MMIRVTYKILCCLALLLPLALLSEESGQKEKEETGHTINFYDAPIVEVIRFVSRISEVNFIFNNKELEFNVTMSSGKPVSSENVLRALLHMLKSRGFGVTQEDNYFVIHQPGEDYVPDSSAPLKREAPSFASLEPEPLAREPVEPQEFYVYKLQYHQGTEIEEAIKKIAADLQNQPDKPLKLLAAIHAMQWVKATNSLLCSGDRETLEALKKLIGSLDVPLRQVFIEVLVVETDARKASQFGLEWAAGGKLYDKVGFGMGSFGHQHEGSHFAKTMQGINAHMTPSGPNQIPMGRGFDLGVIGDIILHKGKSFLSLGTLVSALEADGDSTIVLNQKIITQDNKNSKIFVGDNIPFTGSVVQTVGQSQQTTANIEYRDIGVSLSITPMLGEGEVITLDIDEEITESVNDVMASTTTVNGIRTTKTNMATHVHVPNKHFLVLSGMARNAKTQHKTGVPFLGRLPLIGSLFSKTKKQDERRNILIFVRPHIIHSMEEYQKVTKSQAIVPEIVGGNFEGK